MKNSIYCLILLFQLGCSGDKAPHLLEDGHARAYIEKFNRNDNELYSQHVPNDSAFFFLAGNIPFVELPDKVIEINPLVPDNWDWFCLDRVLYQGRELTIVWDRTGKKYGLGPGLLLYMDGELKVKAPRIEKFIYTLE